MLIRQFICFRTFSLSLGVLALTLTNYLYAQGWDPEEVTNKEEAQTIGNWAGELFEKPFEISIWPSPKFRRLTGTMIWGSCKTGLNVWLNRTSVNEVEPSLPNGVHPSRVFHFSALSEEFVSRQFDATTGETLDIGFKFSNNECPELGIPGYSREFKFLLVSDESYSSLTVYTQKNGQENLEKLTGGTLLRIEPSAQMNVAIEELSRVEIFKPDNSSMATIRDPSKNYLEVYESIIFDPNLEYSKDWYYWNEYDFSIARIIAPLFNGEFDPVEHDNDYYDLYINLMENYGSQCNEYINDRRVVQANISTTTRDRFGNYDRNSATSSIEIESRYSETYIRVKEDRLGWGLPSESEALAVRKIYATEGCDSQTTYQLLENYHRSINFLPPLQRARN